MSYAANFKLIDFSREIPAPAKQFVASGPKRSDLPCPRVMSDVMDAVQSQVDGRMYDSKSAIRAHYKQAGVIEVGNDPARLRSTAKVAKASRKEIKETVAKARARVERGERNLFPGK